MTPRDANSAGHMGDSLDTLECVVPVFSSSFASETRHNFIRRRALIVTHFFVTLSHNIDGFRDIKLKSHSCYATHLEFTKSCSASHSDAHHLTFSESHLGIAMTVFVVCAK